MKVLAPKTRVTQLVTPKSYLGAGGTAFAFEKNQLANLERHLEKSLKPGVKTITIVDFEGSGLTRRSITSALRKIGFEGEVRFAKPDKLFESGFAIFGLELSYQGVNPLGWSKKSDGSEIRQGFSPKKAAQKRRNIYNLGIAIAKEYKMEKLAAQK